MKKAGLVFILLLASYSFNLFGKTVPYERAKAVAENWFKHVIKDQHMLSNEIVDSFTIGETEEHFMYVFNFKEGGWVLVPKYDVAIPILAYSLENNLNIDIDYLNIGIFKYFANSLESAKYDEPNESLTERWINLENGKITYPPQNSPESYEIGTTLLDTE